MDRRIKAGRRWMLAVALVAVLVLSACGQSSSPGSGGSGRDAEPASGDQAPGDSPAGTGPSELYVAVVGPMTGDYAEYGKYMRDAVQLAIDEINASGVLDGAEIKLLVEDDKLDPKEATNVAQKLSLDQRVLAVVGHFGSGTSLAALPIYTENRLSIVSPSNTSPDLSGASPYYFRTIMSDTHLASALARYAVEKMGAQKIAVLFVATDGTITQARVFREQAEALGATVVLNEQHQVGDKDFTAVVDKVKQVNPDLVFMSTWYTEAALIARQAREAGVNTPLLATDGVYAPGLIELGGGAVEGFRFGATFHPALDNPRTRAFVEAFTAKYGYEPEAYGANSYDAMHLIGLALANGGTTREAVQQYLAGIGSEHPAFEGATGINAFDENHDVVKDVVIVEVSGDQFIPAPVQP